MNKKIGIRVGDEIERHGSRTDKDVCYDIRGFKGARTYELWSKAVWVDEGDEEGDAGGRKGWRRKRVRKSERGTRNI